MSLGVILRIILIVAGIALLARAIVSLAKRKMTEPFCLTWGLVSIIVILAGILLNPTELNRYISETGLLLVVMLGFCVAYGAYFMSSRISQLMRKNLELTLQVSILTHEKDEIYKRLDEISAKLKEEGEGNEEGSVRN